MIYVVGLSYKTAPIEVRERFSANKELGDAVRQTLAQRTELREVVFLSTCNRVEVLAEGTDLAPRAIREVLSEHGGISTRQIEGHLYEYAGEAAVRHIFRVAASLDSMVLGEPQILGQVKDSVEAAARHKALKNFLGRCMDRAFSVAKRVRSDTALGAGTVSISSVAVDLARQIFGSLTDRTVLLVGAGDMAEAAARSLGKEAKAIRVCNRNFDRGAALAQAFAGSAAPWEALERELSMADVVLTSTGAQSFVISRDMVSRATRGRRGRPLFFIDIALPRNVDPSVHGHGDVYVYDIDDLQSQVAEGLRSREQEVSRAEALVHQEVDEFCAWARALDVQPTLVAFRTRTRAILAQELERTLAGKLKHLPESDRAALAQMLDAATNKLLHAPTQKLKGEAARDNAADLARILTELFELPEETLSDDRPSLRPPPSLRPGATGMSN